MLKAVYAATFLLWISAMAGIATTQSGFSAQAPMCMASTMVIFGIATLIIKWMEKKAGS
jgi:hypothetical protein